MLLRALLHVTHPFEGIPSRRRRNLFIALLLLTLLVLAVEYLVGAPLETAAAPGGLRSLQLAGDPIVCNAIIASWDAPNQMRACFLVGLDFLLLLLYTNTACLACVWAAEQFDFIWLHSLGMWLAWGQWLAAVCGMLGDTATAAILFGQRGSLWPQQAEFQIAYKFYFVSLGLVFILLGLVQNAISAIYARSSARAKEGTQ